MATGSTYSKGRRSNHVFGLGLVVRKKNWRQGIGRAMMERFEIEAQKVIGFFDHLPLLGVSYPFDHLDWGLT